MRSTTVEEPLFSALAETFPVDWQPYVPVGTETRAWPFWVTGGLAGGRVTVTRGGVAFKPWWESRVRGMRPVFAPWSSIEFVRISPRVGICDAINFILFPVLPPNFPQGANVLTFFGPRLIRVLLKIEAEHSPSGFPRLDAPHLDES